jgi:hypothetical protein
MKDRADGAGCLTILVAMIAFSFVAASQSCDVWHSKLRYNIQYGSVPSEHIHVDREPSNCSFWRSPLGLKGCHYEAESHIYRTRTNTSTGEVSTSIDDGPWNNNSGNGYEVKSDVYVTWTRVED